MSAVSPARLAEIYGDGDDPWGFRHSPYEQAKFRKTCRALPRRRYRSALEIGCGNGELARRVSRRCARYAGVDAVETALAAARRAVPRGRFYRMHLPAPLPRGDHDLILLSEILYFLDRPGLDALARQIDRRWPRADILCVTWLGPSGNAIEGAPALRRFAQTGRRRFRSMPGSTRYRIDLARGRP